jgi:hypothetical protein
MFRLLPPNFRISSPNFEFREEGTPRIGRFRKDHVMLTCNRLLFIAFLSSSLLFATAPPALDSKDISLGLVQFETYDEAGHSPYMVVRVIRQTDRVQSFGISNEAGVLDMPLPPGKYCYDAFSQAGRHLYMRRPPLERCFSVKKDQVVEVGVEFKPS